MKEKYLRSKKNREILRCSNSKVGLETIISVGLFETDKYTFEDVKNSNKMNAHHSHDHSHHSHEHKHDLENNIEGFTSISFECLEPFSLRRFQNFLDNQLSQNVFRAKGILWFEESERKHIFHLSGKRFSLDDEDWKNEKSNRIVLIGKNLNHQEIKDQLDFCRSTSLEK